MGGGPPPPPPNFCLNWNPRATARGAGGLAGGGCSDSTGLAWGRPRGGIARGTVLAGVRVRRRRRRRGAGPCNF